jgi:excisionase family DNA binding protein
MPIAVNGQTYYRTKEVCRMVGISRNTLFRWLKEGKVTDVEYRDFRGWRLFTQTQVDTIKSKITDIRAIHFKESIH